jgi:anti-sigma factor RsiW
VNACSRPEDLYLYLEGGLGPYEARKLEEHLERCPACRERLAERRLLHEAFTSLPPFEVPPDFARSVMDKLPEPEQAGAGWLAPLAAATASLAVSLLGFYLFTGQSLLDVLVAVNRFFGSAIARLAPMAAKTLKLGELLLEVASDLVTMAVAGFETLIRAAGPGAVALALGLGALLSFLVFFGARRLLSLGERT